MRAREWLEETHGPGFELLRHFLLRFFDSDLITHPGQTAAALIGAFSIFAPWFPFVVGPLKEKYAYVSRLPVAEPYRQAVLADELWLITLMMSATGLLTAMKWQALFPGLADYRVLGPLPLRSRQIFAAKLGSLILVASAAVVTLNLLPGIGFPAVSASRWAINPSMGARIAAHLGACVSASYFFFFALVAVQGVLLHLLRGPRFSRVAGLLQWVLTSAMLILIVVSFSIEPQVTATVLEPRVARWLPPVWFLGWHQAMLGDPNPAMATLALEARWGLVGAIGLVLMTYVAGYRRHRRLLVEGPRPSANHRRWHGLLLDRIVPEPAEQAVTVFLARMLAGSSQHRMVLMGYGAFGLALSVTAIPGLRRLVAPERLAAACFIYVHVILLILLLMGTRHLFSIPVELRAHWIFQITEGQGRRRWMRAVDRFVLFWGALVVIAVPFPLEVKLLGWRAASEAVLIAALGLLIYQALFSSWAKLPFTCSYLPGKTPMWIRALQLFALLGSLPMVNAILLECLYHPLFYAAALTILAGVSMRLRAARREAWHDVPLRYDEAPEPAVHSLNLLR